MIEKKKYQNSPLDNESGLMIVNVINKIMLERRLYLQSDISLDKLAQASGLSKHYVSQAINESMGINFFHYINSFRINEAKELLLRPRNELTVIEVAYQIGYNNKVSFNKAFKNLVGVTPTEFRSCKLQSP